MLLLNTSLLLQTVGRECQRCTANIKGHHHQSQHHQMLPMLTLLPGQVSCCLLQNEGILGPACTAAPDASAEHFQVNTFVYAICFFPPLKRRHLR